MYHYKARIYSPTLGRFLQTDPIGYEDQINLYAYVANDPVNRIDPTGRVAIATCPWCDERGEILGVENLPIGNQIIAQAHDGNSEGSVQNPLAGADIALGYVTTYAFVNVSAAVAVGGEARIGGYAVTDLNNGEVIEKGFVVGGLAGFGADAAIGGGVQVSPGRPTNGVTFAAQGSVGAVSIDSQEGVGLNVSPIPLPASGIAGILVQKHIPMYKSKNWTEPY